MICFTRIAWSQSGRFHDIFSRVMISHSCSFHEIFHQDRNVVLFLSVRTLVFPYVWIFWYILFSCLINYLFYWCQIGDIPKKMTSFVTVSLTLNMVSRDASAHLKNVHLGTLNPRVSSARFRCSSSVPWSTPITLATRSSKMNVSPR